MSWQQTPPPTRQASRAAHQHQAAAAAATTPGMDSICTPMSYLSLSGGGGGSARGRLSSIRKGGARAPPPSPVAQVIDMMLEPLSPGNLDLVDPAAAASSGVGGVATASRQESQRHTAAELGAGEGGQVKSGNGTGAKQAAAAAAATPSRFKQEAASAAGGSATAAAALASRELSTPVRGTPRRLHGRSSAPLSPEQQVLELMLQDGEGVDDVGAEGIGASSMKVGDDEGGSGSGDEDSDGDSSSDDDIDLEELHELCGTDAAGMTPIEDIIEHMLTPSLTAGGGMMRGVEATAADGQEGDVGPRVLFADD